MTENSEEGNNSFEKQAQNYPNSFVLKVIYDMNDTFKLVNISPIKPKHKRPEKVGSSNKRLMEAKMFPINK
jgi:hypothetical protein